MNGKQSGDVPCCVELNLLSLQTVSFLEGSFPMTLGFFEFSPCLISIEGVWEGFFTYTEFTAYAAMLGGADPQFIQKSIVGRHQQTWKLREWHLISDQEGGVDSLSAGDPLFSYFPVGCKLSETSEDLSVREAGRRGTFIYSRGGTKRGNVVDIIITGEGHSAWGQFRLTGRIRPCDGFISLSKDYVRWSSTWLPSSL